MVMSLERMSNAGSDRRKKTVQDNWSLIRS